MSADSITRPQTLKTIHLQNNRLTLDPALPKSFTYQGASIDEFNGSLTSPFAYKLDINNAGSAADSNFRKIFLLQPGLYQVRASCAKFEAYASGQSWYLRILLFTNNGVTVNSVANASSDYLGAEDSLACSTQIRITPNDLEGNPYVEMVAQGTGTMAGWNPAARGGAAYDTIAKASAWFEIVRLGT